MKKIFFMLLAFGPIQAMYCQDTISKKLDDLMTAYAKVNKFNGTVLVARKGKVLLRKGYGVKDIASADPMHPNNIFQIYSITKTFTSTLLLKLVEGRKISLDDKLSRFYPEIPKSDSITIEHLLTHTSGIFEYRRGYDMPDYSEASFIKFLQKKPLDFSPGTSWAYSNSGYWLLGFIIGKICGIGYEEAVRKFIFEPLKMRNSGFDYKQLAHKRKTTGYAIFSDSLKKEAIVYESPGPFAAGAIYSTLDDLYKYHQALQKYSLLAASTQKNAYTPGKNNYGFGWMIHSYEGKQVVSHSGGAAGFRSNLARIPGSDVCIILLNNHENANVELITKNILHILFARPYKVPAEIMLLPSQLDKLSGVYVLRPSFNMYITREDNKLVAQASGQHKTVLLAEKDNYFYAEEANGFLEFKLDSAGVYSELILHQRGEKMAGKRIYPTWGVCGTATSKGWEQSIPDIAMKEDSARKGIWRLENISLKTGLLIFRLNNDWGYHYGDNGRDYLLEMYGEDIPVQEGIYDIVLDLTKPVLPAFKLEGKH